MYYVFRQVVLCGNFPFLTNKKKIKKNLEVTSSFIFFLDREENPLP